MGKPINEIDMAMVDVMATQLVLLEEALAAAIGTPGEAEARLKLTDAIQRTNKALIPFEQPRDKVARIRELYRQKAQLLDTYGIFGGGPQVNAMHDRINGELEALGVDPNS